MFEGFFGEGRVGRVRGEGSGGGGGDEGSVVLADLRGEEGAELAVRAGVGSQCVDCQMMAMAEADTRRVSCNGSTNIVKDRLQAERTGILQRGRKARGR